MSKKKKHKKRKSVLDNMAELDMSMDNIHDLVLSDLDYMNTYIRSKDRKVKKKAKKHARNGILSAFNPNEEMSRYRLKVVETLERTNIIDIVENLLKQIAPIIILIARLVASLILLILQFSPIRNMIRPSTMKRLDGIYEIAMAIH